MIVQGGFTTYGELIGILMFKGISPRLPGDLGYAGTLDVNVCYEILDNVRFIDLVTGSEKTKEILIAAAKRLENKGVKAITGDCGLLARYQKKIASELKVPFFSSSLLMLPLIWTLQGQVGEIGIITGHSDFLKEDHLISSGVTDEIKLCVAGMENEEEFKKVVLKGSSVLDSDKMEQGLVDVCSKLIKEHPEIKSILLECTNLPTYSAKINKIFNMPVYDIVNLAKLVSLAVNPYTFI